MDNLNLIILVKLLMLGFGFFGKYNYIKIYFIFDFNFWKKNYGFMYGGKMFVISECNVNWCVIRFYK